MTSEVIDHFIKIYRYWSKEYRSFWILKISLKMTELWTKTFVNFYRDLIMAYGHNVKMKLLVNEWKLHFHARPWVVMHQSCVRMFSKYSWRALWWGKSEFGPFMCNHGFSCVSMRDHGFSCVTMPLLLVLPVTTVTSRALSNLATQNSRMATPLFSQKAYEKALVTQISAFLSNCVAMRAHAWFWRVCMRALKWALASFGHAACLLGTL